MLTHGREQNFAKTALALMEDAGVVATPENFELFYAFASGENPAVTQMMAAFVNAKKVFTPEILADLKLRCLSGARTAREMESLGGNIDADRGLAGCLHTVQCFGQPLGLIDVGRQFDQQQPGGGHRRGYPQMLVGQG